MFDRFFIDSFRHFDDLFKESSDLKHSYFHEVADEYENGEHISHKEKEVKDGKVLKDVDTTKCLTNKKEENKDVDETVDDLRKTIESYKKVFKKLKRENKELRKKLAKKEEEI